MSKTLLEAPCIDIAMELNDLFVAKPSVTLECSCFIYCDHVTGKCIPHYMAQLHHLALHYLFESWMDRLLCDQLVCGFRNEALRRTYLLSQV